MGLDDFEKALAESKTREDEEVIKNRDEDSRSSHRHRDERDRHGHHHHRHRPHRHRDDQDDHSARRHRHHRQRDGVDDHDQHEDEDRRRRHKRRRRDRDDDAERSHTRRHRSRSTERVRGSEAGVRVFDSDGDEEWVEKGNSTALPEQNTGDQQQQDQDQELRANKVQRDFWMQEPSALDIDYVQRPRPKTPPGQFVSAKADHEFKVHESQVNQHLADLQNDFDSEAGEDPFTERVEDQPAQHDVDYTFGDGGSSWRMTKLKQVYRKAEELGKLVEDVAMETYGDLRQFDDAREERRELDRRDMYGSDYVGLEKPSGELHQERKMKAGMQREREDRSVPADDLPQGRSVPQAEPSLRTVALDQTALNKLKAQMMKAKLKKAPNASQLEEEYKAAEAASLANATQPDVIVLNNAENRMLAGDRSGEVTELSGRRAWKRGNVKENEDMSIEDMVKQEKRTRGVHGGEGRAFAERIAKDGKFKNDLDYMDDNASNLSKKVIKSDANLRNAAVGDFQKMQRILENCPLCYHEESNTPPVAPVVSLATRTYMTLPTEPELARNGAVIVPIQHHLNLLECDDDEWEEIRNFMKSLIRFYHSQDRGVIFYENAAHMHSRKGHAALIAVPLPHHLAENAPAYFKEAMLAEDEEWAQHKKVIDTLALTQRPGYGKAAFRKAIAKEMPYFHVFYTLDGGAGHVIDDERRWPKGDLFAREIIGGMLGKGPEVVKKQGRWERHDRRLDAFRKKWTPHDWTTVLMDAQ